MYASIYTPGIVSDNATWYDYKLTIIYMLEFNEDLHCLITHWIDLFDYSYK